MKSSAETEKGIFDAILKEEIDFVSQPWPIISNSAKDLVRKMLTKDPKKRISSTEVLGNMPSVCICIASNFIYCFSGCL